MPNASNPNLLRDHLANERTFLAWMRTAITIVALGFVVAKFGILLREVGGPHVHALTAKLGAAVGFLLVLAGIVTIAFALVKFLRIRTDIELGQVRVSIWLDVTLALMVAIVAAILAAYLIITA